MTTSTIWKMCIRPLTAMCFALTLFTPSAASAQPAGGALAGERLRILISSDIGGSDGDDIQSMIHVLLYSDLFDIEGLVSSPPYAGRKADFLPAIAAYEQDYPRLLPHGQFPTPNSLRALTKQGAINVAPAAGYSVATEGSNWIIQQANRSDPRPLYVLVWGSITDVAQALRDDPGIKSKIRVHFIASWNRLQDPNAFAYINNNHTDLWMIQDESSFRGWFTGGNQSGDLGNISFPQNHLFGKGALGVMFSQVQAAHAQVGEIKMGDTPTFARLLRGTPGDPGQPGWGGHFVRHSSRPNWWVDVTDPLYKEGKYFGAKTVNQWREAYLRDWQNRQLWLDVPPTGGALPAIEKIPAANFAKGRK